MLLGYIETTYAQPHVRLLGLIDRREIAYDLLGALFKPNEEMYMLCRGSGKPMCFKCNYGEEMTRMNGSEYFRIEGRYFNHDGKILGESTLFVDIDKFRGAKRIDHLLAYPLRLHQNSTRLRSSLSDRGRTFVALVEGYHYRQYQGQAFRKDDKGDFIKTSIDGRVVVDLDQFRFMNPNYNKPRVDTMSWDAFIGATPVEGNEGRTEVDRVDVGLAELSLHDLVLCSPTVRGFSLTDRSWRMCICVYRKQDRALY